MARRTRSELKTVRCNERHHETETNHSFKPVRLIGGGLCSRPDGGHRGQKRLGALGSAGAKRDGGIYDHHPQERWRAGPRKLASCRSDGNPSDEDGR